MIKLNAISTSKLYSKILKRYNNAETLDILEWLNILAIFDNNEITDYQRLKDMLEEFKTNKFYRFIRNDLKSVERKVDEANMLGVKPEIYTQEWYKGTNIDDKSLNITDNETMGNVLLISNPLHVPTRQQRKVNLYSIAKIKFLLAHLQSDLRNEFKFNSGCYSKEDLVKLIELIKFYEQQVERQAKEIQENSPYLLPTNIFDVNNIYKQDIVESQLTEISEYLVDNGNRFIWGNLCDADKLRLLKVIKQPKNYARKNFINVISNYTTLSELEEGLVKKRTLDRFIVR